MINRTAIAAAAVSAALLASPLLAQTKQEQGKSADRAAQTFVTKAANGGMYEVESSRVALEKAQRAEVKDFAQQMITDHEKANAELKQVADKIGAKVPEKMDRTHQRRVDQLNSRSAAQFDRAYLDGQYTAHKDSVQLFQRYAKSGRNAELKQFAEQTLPTLESHAEELRAVRTGGAATGASSGNAGQGTAGKASQQRDGMGQGTTGARQQGAGSGSGQGTSQPSVGGSQGSSQQPAQQR